MNAETTSWQGSMLLVVDRSAWARFGRMFQHLALALSGDGVRVAVLTDAPELAEDLLESPVSPHLVATLTGWPSLWLDRPLRRMLPKMPDLVHLWGTPSLRALARWTQRGRARLYVHLTAEEELEHIVRRGPRPNEYPVALCGAYAAQVGKRWQRPPLPVIPPGLSAPESVEEGATRGRTIGVLWAGNCDEGSGLPVLIDAIGRIPLEEMDVQVAIVGDGPELDDTWKEIRQRGVADRFSLIGGSRLWDQAVPGVDICVVTARQNPLRLAPLLAMAHGKLVLATENQSAEWFIADQTCATFPAGDAGALATLLRNYRDGHPGLLAIARAARAHVSGQFAVSAMAGKMLNLYAESA